MSPSGTSHDWVAASLADPKLNLTRDGKYRLDDAGTAALKRRFVGFISSVSEGTAIPAGPPLKDAHLAANFKPEEYTALVDQLRTALKLNGVAEADAQVLAKKLEDGKAEVLGTAGDKSRRARRRPVA